MSSSEPESYPSVPEGGAPADLPAPGESAGQSSSSPRGGGPPPQSPGADESAAAVEPAAVAVRYRFPLLTIPALALLVGGALVAFRHPGGEVTQIKLTRLGGLTDLMPGVGAPDFFLEIHTRERVIATEPKVDVPIGNGLTWQLPEPTLLEDIQEIEVYDQDFFSDDRLDRMSITDWVTQGQQFRVEMIGDRSPIRGLAILAGFLGGAYLLYAVGKFIRDQVV